MKTCVRVPFVAAISILSSVDAAVAQQSGSGDLEEIVVNGIKRGDLILPTTVTSASAYGLDLGVMDTPRNNTVLSKAQLDALNIQNPAGFSYLTSSSYSDASFGVPNVPRIRGQYADVFYNGMRDSFTLNGEGSPMSFNSVDSIDIVKGPASVQGGPGPGVGGAVDITTKMPSFTASSAVFNVEFDTQQKRRASFDLDGPLTANLAGRVSVTTDDSGSYYYDEYFHQQSLFAAVLAEITPRYTILVTGSLEDSVYREIDGVNRVNQALIDNGTYLTGGATAPVANLLTPVYLGNPIQLNDRIVIDEAPGTGARSLHAKGQLIQTLKAADNFSIVNDTFYDYDNRYNQVQAYYSDASKGSYTIENKTDFKVTFATGAVKHDVDAGFTYRYAHVDDIQDYANEPVGTYDLSQSPLTWIFPASLQGAGGAVPYVGAFGRVLYGVSGRDPFDLNGSIISNLQDGAIFLEHRLQLSPEWSVMYGLRGDLVQLNETDPLGGAASYGGLPQKESTGWYGLRNGNVSLVYSPSSHISTYLTYNNAQYVDSNADDGGVGTFGEAAGIQLRQDTSLEEAGMKFDLLDKSLFISSALYKQTRAVPIGPGSLGRSWAHIRGAEVELNYQPDPHFFATASYSYLHTLLDTPSTFYNYPAQSGVNIDGAGVLAVFQPNQTFSDPGVPEHLFNALANYKFDSGWGAQANIQVTGPIQTTQSGYLNLAKSAFVPASIAADGGYYQSPVIPWQYTLNAAVFHRFEICTIKLSVYNLTDRHNVVNDNPFYGNDFLTRVPPRSFDVTLTGKF